MNNEAERQPAIITRIACCSHSSRSDSRVGPPRGYEPGKGWQFNGGPVGDRQGKIGFEPADGAGGPSSEKHTILGIAQDVELRGQERKPGLPRTPFSGHYNRGGYPVAVPQ